MNSNLRGIAVLAFLLISSFFVATVNVRTASATAQDITKIEPTSLTITVGNTDVVTITTTDPITSSTEVVWTDLGGIIEEVKTEVSGNTAVTTLRAVKFSPTPKEIKVKVGGSTPKTVTVTTLTVVKTADFPTEPGPSPTVKQDQRVSIPLNNLVGVNVPDEGLEVTSADESVVSGVRRGTSIIITGIKPSTSPVRITVKSNGQVIKTYDVTVVEAMDRIESEVTSIDLTEGQIYTLSSLHVKVTGKSNGDLTAVNEFKPRFSSTQPALAEVDAAETTLTARRAPKDDEEAPKLIIQPGGNAARAISIPIRITPAAKKANLTGQGKTVFVNRSETFVAEVLDSQENRVNDAQIDWTIPDAADKLALTIMNSRGTQVTVEGLAPKDGVKLVGTVRQSLPGAQPITVELFLNVKSTNVSGFAPLAIRIDLLDFQTAKDLFGKKAADEFFISKIRLFNKLKNQNGEFGDSILVYSESLEVRVQLEWRNKDGGTDWTPLPTTGATSYQSLFGEPTIFPNLPGDPRCTETAQPNFVAHYRPYTFDIIANTHDRRDERSVRTRILTVANGLSSLASFVTSIAVPAPGNDTRLGLDQFKGLLIPSFEKLFPSLKEVQRQNIISMVMRPLEEIPFGSDVTRILFIPKGKLYGMIPGKVFRIGGVSTTGACAEVGIIKKAGSIPQ